MRYAAIERADGGVTVMTLFNDADLDTEVAKWQQTSKTQALSWRLITELPQSRRFRDAWKVVNGKIDVDLPRAKAIKRNELLTQAKKAMLEAVTEGDDTKASQVKQRITRIKTAILPDDLTALENWQP